MTDDTYRRLTPETDEFSYEDVLLCPRVSKILVNVFRVTRKGSRPSDREWHSVQEIDIDTGEINTVLTPHDIPVEPPYSKAWISRLRNVTSGDRKHMKQAEPPDDEYVSEPEAHTVYGSGGKEILCTVSFRKKKSGHDETVEDFLCKVSPETHAYRKISRIINAAKDLIATGKAAGGKALDTPPRGPVHYSARHGHLDTHRVLRLWLVCRGLPTGSDLISPRAAGRPSPRR